MRYDSIWEVILGPLHAYILEISQSLSWYLKCLTRRPWTAVVLKWTRPLVRLSSAAPLLFMYLSCRTVDKAIYWKNLA